VPSQFLEFGGRFHPSSSNADATFIANTTVTATQGSVTINVPDGNSIPDPYLFDARIAYNPNLLGAWQLSVANPNYTNSPATFPTRAIDASIGAPAFIMRSAEHRPQRRHRPFPGPLPPSRLPQATLSRQEFSLSISIITGKRSQGSTLLRT